MKVKIFSQINSIDILEQRVNEWLELNESFVIKHIFQSEYAIGNCGDGCTTFSIWYEIPLESPTPSLTSRIQAAAEEIAKQADEVWPSLRCDKCGSLELIRNVPEDGYDCRGCSNFTRTPDEVIGITKIDLEKLATAIIKRHLEVK